MADLFRNTGPGFLQFFVVQSSDGRTPATGEAGNFPQISVNGSAFTGTGAGGLVHLGNGHYQSLIDVVTLGLVPGDRVTGRYSSGATDEAPSLNTLLIVDFDPTLADSYKADVTGIEGSGFNTSLHSLVALRNLIFQLVQPLIVTPFPVESLLIPGSMLSSAVQKVRDATDEPSLTDSKYPDTRIIEKLRDAWGEIWVELNSLTQNPIYTEFAMPLKKDVLSYVLPPHVGVVLRFAERDSVTRLVRRELYPRSQYSTAGAGYRVEGNTIKLGANWQFSDGGEMQVEYIPSGEVSFHTGEWDDVDFSGGDGKVVTLSPSVTSGTFDTRVSAYSGMVLRTLPVPGTAPVSGDPATIQQDLIIGEYNNETREATLLTVPNPPLNLSGKQLAYEVGPWMTKEMRNLMSLRCAQTILSENGLKERTATQVTEYQRLMATVQRFLMDRNARRASQFEADDPRNSRRNRIGIFGRYRRL